MSSRNWGLQKISQPGARTLRSFFDRLKNKHKQQRYVGTISTSTSSHHCTASGAALTAWEEHQIWLH
jgi:hypothetical protein